jgi:hypothetical protein
MGGPYDQTDGGTPPQLSVTFDATAFFPCP